MQVDTSFRAARLGRSSTPPEPVGLANFPAWGRFRQRWQQAAEPEVSRTIYDADNSRRLPGTVARREGAPATGDDAVDEAYDGMGDTWTLYMEAFDRDSVDDQGMPLIGSVHFDNDYDNAFWNGEQMVYGDGDGDLFNRFTISVDVIGHELTHGVTENEAALIYWGQSGALNESVSDVFGSLVKQAANQQTAEDADWLIGEGLFTDKVQGVALRSMSNPGTAYDDPVLGEDPQPADMQHYVRTLEDNAGVHINSGIPNRAFYLTATNIGGYAWEAAGQIWYETLRSSSLKSNAQFSTFARVTVQTARLLYGATSVEADAVLDAWSTVGISVPAGLRARAGRR